ncbi:MAG: ribbon-helix-helix protein, CopG family [Candidatus Marinimicrobia bacterium]|nr:ribbon-helix-helix protein, CopG family [Candidatus Neomarinimicrobiota bacterium]
MAKEVDSVKGNAKNTVGKKLLHKSFKVTNKQNQKLQRLAKAADRSESYIIRQLIEQAQV